MKLKKKDIIMLTFVYVFSVFFFCIFWKMGFIYESDKKPNDLKTAIDYNSLPETLENGMKIVYYGLDGNPALTINIRSDLSSATVIPTNNDMGLNNGMYFSYYPNGQGGDIISGYALEHRYFNYSNGSYNITLGNDCEISYKQPVSSSGRIKLYSTLTNEEITAYGFGEGNDNHYVISNGYLISYQYCSENCITEDASREIMYNVLSGYIRYVLDDYFLLSHYNSLTL